MQKEDYTIILGTKTCLQGKLSSRWKTQLHCVNISMNLVKDQFPFSQIYPCIFLSKMMGNSDRGLVLDGKLSYV